MNFLKKFSFGEINISHYNSYSNSPTLVFLHDSLGCIELWRQFPKKLGELTNCNVFIYDRLGYGKSAPFNTLQRQNNYMELEADYLNEILESCNIKNAILFGHSDGGSISLIAAGKYPEQILGIITEGAHIFVEDITIKGITEAANNYKSTSLKAKLSKYHGSKTDNMFWAWADTWRTEAFRSWNIEHFLPKITCPSLIIQGENDEYGTLMQVERIVSQTKGKSIKQILPNVFHTPHKEVPDQILEISANFIEEVINDNL